MQEKSINKLNSINMRPKFRIGDMAIRKPLPKYKGNGQPIIIIEKITDKYYFGVTTVSDTKVMFDIEHQDDFMLYKPSFIRRIKCWFNNIKLIKSIRNDYRGLLLL